MSSSTKRSRAFIDWPLIVAVVAVLIALVAAIAFYIQHERKLAEERRSQDLEPPQELRPYSYSPRQESADSESN